MSERKRMPKGMPRAGFVPYYIEGDEVYVMLMKPSNPKFGGDDFQIAKGHMEGGEDSKTAALREAFEELGLLTRNIVSVEYLGEYLGYTHIYYGKVKNKGDFAEPGWETGEAMWLNAQEFHAIGRAIHIPILDQISRIVNKQD